MSRAVSHILMFPLSVPGNVHLQFHSETTAVYEETEDPCTVEAFEGRYPA